MANFSTAELVTFQTKLENAFKNNELRFRDPEVFKLFLRNTQFMLPSYMEGRTREDRAIQSNYPIRQSRALGSARSHLHVGVQGDSAVVNHTWTTYTDKYAQTLKASDNKIYSLQEMLMSQMQNVVANMAEGLETVASGTLFGGRSQVNVADSEGLFDLTDFVFQITGSTNGDRMAQITKTVMDMNKYQGVIFDLVCDSTSFNQFEFLFNQGSGNSVNTSFQSGGLTFIHDPKLNAASDGLTGTYDGFWLAVPQGSIGAMPWIPVQNRMGIDTKEQVYGSIINPVDGLSYAVHSYDERGDGTTFGGYLQDEITQVEISQDVSLDIAPSTTANETGIMAFGRV
ncbi:MAG: hypothetical protein COA36_16655 [Desulfotalea sp.]|nr:MAG: hypothetical protein COA36_16655 [Desulfotalea sp.]